MGVNCAAPGWKNTCRKYSAVGCFFSVAITSARNLEVVTVLKLHLNTEVEQLYKLNCRYSRPVKKMQGGFFFQMRPLKKTGVPSVVFSSTETGIQVRDVHEFISSSSLATECISLLAISL